MDIDYQLFIQKISQYIWPIFRITGVFITLPVLSTAVVPAKIRAVLVIFMSIISAQFISPGLSFEFFIPSQIAYIATELLLGLLMGFIFQMVFQAFIIGGQIVAMQSGLGFATMVDPASQANVPLVSQFYLMLVTLVFLALNGHLIVIDILVRSFNTLPIGGLEFDQSLFGQVLEFSVWMFKAAVMVALPAIISLLVVNISFGVMTRAAPQLNIFSIGFPITLTLGIVIIYMSLYGVLPHIRLTLDHGFGFIEGMVK